VTGAVTPELLPAEVAAWIEVTPSGCWSWQGARVRGYGRGWRGRHWRAHRLVWTLLVGPIPDGLTLDHTCHNDDLSCPGGAECLHRACCNPEHLALATRGDNVRNSRRWQRPRVLRTCCRRDHEFTPENTYVQVRADGSQARMCRACARLRDRRARRRDRPVMDDVPAPVPDADGVLRKVTRADPPARHRRWQEAAS
jgi:HNH endonuclease